MAPSSPLAVVLRAFAAESAPGKDVAGLISAVASAGFVHLSDMCGLEAGDLTELVPAFAAYDSGFVSAFLAHCQRHADRELAAQSRQSAGRDGAVSPRPASAATGAVVQSPAAACAARGVSGARCLAERHPAVGKEEASRAALIVLGEARRARTAPSPAVLAAAVAAAAHCSSYPGSAPTGGPQMKSRGHAAHWRAKTI